MCVCAGMQAFTEEPQVRRAGSCLPSMGGLTFTILAHYMCDCETGWKPTKYSKCSYDNLGPLVWTNFCFSTLNYIM